jgi:cardiolipin synthase
LANLPMTSFNKSRLLLNGDETFRSIFDGIESAKEYILVQFYIFFKLAVRSASLLSPIL